MNTLEIDNIFSLVNNWSKLNVAEVILLYNQAIFVPKINKQKLKQAILNSFVKVNESRKSNWTNIEISARSLFRAYRRGNDTNKKVNKWQIYSNASQVGQGLNFAAIDLWLVEFLFTPEKNNQIRVTFRREA